LALRVMLVDDKAYELDSLGLLLETDGYQVSAFSDPREALAHLLIESVDVLVTDLQMPRMSGIELTAAATELYPDLEVVVVTAFGTIETAVEAMRLGAFDYIVKGPTLGNELLVVLERIAQQLLLRRHVASLEGELGDDERLAGVIGRSPEMKEVFRLARAVAPHETTVLIRGETGTGKGILAAAIHAMSPRAKEPFVTVDCAALPDTLLESELFGHVKGAFTGAVASRDGKIKAAADGTACLDEIGELPIGSQPKLLRLLENKVYVPVGSNRELPSSARIIAATNQDLEEMVEEGAFRLDLLHRLNVVTILLPALRDRRDDIPLLVDHLIRRVCRRLKLPTRPVEDAAMKAIVRYSWPGNVRQLVHAIERSMVVGNGTQIALEDLPPEVGRDEAPPIGPGPDASELTDSLSKNERRIVVRVLTETGWNIHESARRLEISRPTLYSKIKKFQLSRAE